MCREAASKTGDKEREESESEKVLLLNNHIVRYVII